jgi:predicted dehydrogenase
VRLGVIGAGFWAAQAHIPALLGTGRCRVVALCRRDPALRARVAAHFGVERTYGDASALLDGERDLDAVLIATPHALHAAQVRQCLERGLHVLTEKPLALRAQEAAELATLALARGRVLLVAYNPPFEAATRWVRARVDAGALGRVHHLTLTGLGNLAYRLGRPLTPEEEPGLVVGPTAFRADPALAGGGGLLDVGSHTVARALAITGGRAVAVSAQMDDPLSDRRAAILLHLEDGAFCALSVYLDAFTIEPPLRWWGYTHVHGSLGDVVETDPPSGSRLSWRQGQGDLTPVPAAELPEPTSAGAHFVAAVLDGVPLLAPPEFAVEVTRVLEAAYDSARTCRTVHLGASGSPSAGPHTHGTSW